MLARVFLGIYLFAFAGFSLADTEVHIYGKNDGAPIHYLSEDGTGKGYAFEIAVEAVHRSGYRSKVVARPWARAQLEASSGKGIITAFSKTPERQKLYLYTQPIYYDRVLLVQHADRPFSFSRWQDLEGKTIGIGRGVNYAGDVLQQREHLSLVEDDGHLQRLQKLMAMRIDAGIFPGDIYLLKYYARMNGTPLERLHIAPTVVVEEANYIGVPRNLLGLKPKQLREVLDRAIEGMWRDGTIEAIFRRYRDLESASE